MTNVRVEPRPDAVDVSLEGSLTIDTVTGRQGHFQSALAFGRPITVHVDQVQAFDLTGMQLCLALRRDGAARDTPVTFSGPATVERFNRMLAYAGLPEV